MTDPDVRARMIAQVHAMADDPIVGGFMHPDHVFVLGDPPNYEPPARRASAPRRGRRAAIRGRTSTTCCSSTTGANCSNAPVLNYTDGNLDSTYEMLSDPVTAFGLGDGGAHAGQTCDASSTTFLLTYWGATARATACRSRLAVHQITGATADLYGLGDRGRLVPGQEGRRQPHRPRRAPAAPAAAGARPARRREAARPAASRRLRRHDQRRRGHASGGEDTGARPGVLLRERDDGNAGGGHRGVLGRALRPGLGADPLVLHGGVDLLRRPGRPGRGRARARSIRTRGYGWGSTGWRATSNRPGVVVADGDLVVTEHVEVWRVGVRRRGRPALRVGTTSGRRQDPALEGLLGPADVDDRRARRVARTAGDGRPVLGVRRHRHRLTGAPVKRGGGPGRPSARPEAPRHRRPPRRSLRLRGRRGAWDRAAVSTSTLS